MASGYGFDSDFKTLPVNTVVKFVPQQEAWIVERMGKYNQTLEGGLAILVPFLDSITYVHSLKEVTISIPSQSAITGDNVTLSIDGVLYYKILDPYKASYLGTFHYH
jgi:regulator of protease activity HflC (stomatin/prohibitin superfamily)